MKLIFKLLLMAVRQATLAVCRGIEMIDKDKFHVLNYIKKEEYTGSMDGMRYMLKKKEKEDGSGLEVIIWPEPYCFAKTPEEKKQRREFALSADGVREAADYLNAVYQEQKEVWERAKWE